MRPRKRTTARAFTLVELMLVIVILSTLAAIVIPRLVGRSQDAKKAAAQAQIANFETALDAFEIDNSYFPEGGDGLQELIDEPANNDDWRGPYLKKGIPNDPWKKAYIYEYPGKHNENGYDISSMGPDGRVGGDDDIVNWIED